MNQLSIEPPEVEINKSGQDYALSPTIKPNLWDSAIETPLSGPGGTRFSRARVQVCHDRARMAPCRPRQPRHNFAILIAVII
jgi:hypothetical protein